MGAMVTVERNKPMRSAPPIISCLDVLEFTLFDCAIDAVRFEPCLYKVFHSARLLAEVLEWCHFTNSFAISIRKGTDRINPTRVAWNISLSVIIILLVTEFTGWVVGVTAVGVVEQLKAVASFQTSLRFDLLCF